MNYKKLKCKKEYGIWYYTIEKATQYNDLDGSIYHLFNKDLEPEYDFAYYGDMKYYIETGIVI